MHHRITLSLMALCLASACATTVRPPLAGSEPAQASRLQELFAARAGEPTRAAYRIGVGDTLRVSVPQAEEISGEFAVPEDGKLSLPLVGDVVAAGRSETEVSDAIAAVLRAEYLQAPEVIVSVTNFVGRKVTVTGAVARPGFFELRGSRETMLDLLTRAGGITDEASPKIYFTPGSDAPARGPQVAMVSQPGVAPASALLASSEDQPIEVDLTELYQGGSVPALQLPVRNGDVIFVKEGGQVYVEGWVEDPKAYPLKRAMTLSQAVAKAGGLHFAASSVRLSREDSKGALRDYPVNFSAIRSGSEKDIYLEPGDRIYVTGNPVKVGLWGVYNTVTSIVRFSIAGGVAAF